MILTVFLHSDGLSVAVVPACSPDAQASGDGYMIARGT